MERHTDDSVDEERIASLRESVDADGVDALAERLHSDDADERAGAAWRLVEAATTEPTKVRAVLDDVRAAAGDDDVWVRRGATWVLAELAERQPDALSVQFSELVSLTAADDPLVQQNGVVAVAGVTKAYPARASAGLSAIARLTRSENALVRRYAEEAVEEVTAAVAERAEDAGYPVVVRAHPAYADLFPEGVSVVETGGDDDRSRPIHVSFGQNAPVHEDDRENERPEAGRPEEIPDPPDVTLEEEDVSPNLKLREGVLTTDYRADVDEDVLEHGLATVRRLRADESAVASAFAEAVEQWAGVDDHDHVVAVLGHGARWLATRYDDGDALDGRGAPVTLAEAVWNASVLTRAVSHAHSRGVVHGGLHPGAVRFVATGPRTWDAPLLGDWGFAHAASARRTPPIPGAFAAPEHRDPETYGRFDQATDVYGLGALTYFLLTGEPPGSGDERIPASERNPALPASADDLFARALAPEKRARFATVLDFQRALDDFAANLDGVSR
ncbi:ARM/HEAT repeat protein / protein kinase domain protein [Halobacterium hubeiense]|uniref:ARM/HEAT repeat protein / protein kinase domain protein n=1 Tax=Halobacterium hubeiense TaxID=1407499 RepID=A0A0U5H3B4_9EURY|nr:protein kinase [Halobacterium hubeiense]CQH54606.1 ARM/HEAT repeat protein / protein kinase domain protein [Halobacterium hubeiense]